MENPNLFDYATSELSQDAFLAWLLAWADDSYVGPVHELGRAFVASIFGRCGKTMPPKLSVWAERQHSHIDVYAKINDRYVIIIEDKVGTREHDDQLVRYRNLVVEEGADPRDVLCVYCQTEEQSDKTAIYKAGYLDFDRAAMLSLLRSDVGLLAAGSNAIIGDYAAHLMEVDAQYAAFRQKGDWDYRAWKGFFSWLKEKRGGEGNWDYVANPSGGFMGYWFYWDGLCDGLEIYLQLECERACFKIYVEDARARSNAKYEWRDRITKSAKALGFEDRVSNPTRLANGQYMTVKVWRGDIRIFDGKGVLDEVATLENIKVMERIVDEAARQYREDEFCAKADGEVCKK